MPGSIRVAAVRAEELLEERTLPYDEDAVERLLRRWPGGALLLRGRADWVRLVSASCRAQDRLYGRRAGAGAAAAWGSGEDRSS